MSARLLSEAMVLFFLLAIGWLFYLVFNDLKRSLAAAIASSFGAVFGMPMLCDKNLNVLEICSALVFVVYTW